MNFLPHFNFIALVMTPAFWIGLAAMLVVMLGYQSPNAVFLEHLLAA